MCLCFLCGKTLKRCHPLEEKCCENTSFPSHLQETGLMVFSSYLHSSLTREALRFSSVLLDLVRSPHQNPISVSADFPRCPRAGAGAELLSCASAPWSSNNHPRASVCKEGSKPLHQDVVREKCLPHPWQSAVEWQTCLTPKHREQTWPFSVLYHFVCSLFPIRSRKIYTMLDIMA